MRLRLRAVPAVAAFFALLLTLALLTLAPESRAASFDPALKWHTFDTPHFRIYYYTGEEFVAQRVAQLVEPIRLKVTKAVDYTPRGRTHLVITDTTDDANGFTLTIPYNMVRIYAAAPTEGSELAVYDDYLNILITHEFTHVCHIGKIAGMPIGLRYVFGTIVAPDDIEPEWITEGYATYQETALTTGGRGRASYSDMLVRTAAYEHNFPHIDQADGFQEVWPSGDIRYIFGVEFLQWLRANFGDAAVVEFTREIASDFLPFYPFYPRISHDAKVAFKKDGKGQGIYKLWGQWRASVEADAAETAARLSQEPGGITKAEQLTHHGGTTIAPRLSPDGKKIVYASANGKEYANIRLVDIDGKHDKVIISRFFSDSFGWSADGQRIAFGSEKLWRDFYNWNDIYTWSLDDSVLTRMTRGARARTPDYKPDGTMLMFAVNDESNSDLATLKVDQTVNWLTDNRDFTQYSTPRWRPDGQAIALSGWFPGGYREVAIANTAGKITNRITADRFINRDPTWTADGHYVIFSSDRTGIANLYAFEPDSSRYWQITNLMTGAWSPSVTPDNTWIVFQGYTSAGFDVFRMPFDTSKWKEVGWTFDPAVYDATCTPTKQPTDPPPMIVPHADAGCSVLASAGPALGDANIAHQAYKNEFAANQGNPFVRPHPMPPSFVGPGRNAPGMNGVPEEDESDVDVVDHSVDLTLDQPVPSGESVSAEKVTGGGVRPKGAPDKNKGVDLGPDHPRNDFHPYQTLAPRYWVPASLYITESGTYIGVETGGTDPLFRHSWVTDIDYNTEAGYLGGSARYYYDRFKPTFYGGLDSYAVDYGQLLYNFPNLQDSGNHLIGIQNSGHDYFEQHLVGTLGAYWLYHYRYFYSLFYSYDERSAWTKISEYAYQPYIPVRGAFAGPTLAVSVDRTSGYAYSISPEQGYRVTATVQALEHIFGSSYRQEIATVDARYYYSMPLIPYSVLALRGVAGYSQGDNLNLPTFRLGGALGESAFTLTTPNYYSLRGFPFFAFGGSQMVLGSAEYRVPIWRANRGLGEGPFFLHMVHGSVFIDSGEAFSTGQEYAASNMHTGVGAEIRFDTIWYYFFPLTIRLGYAFALNNDPAGYAFGNVNGYIFTLGTSF